MVHVKRPDPGLSHYDFELLRPRSRVDIPTLSQASLVEVGQILKGLASELEFLGRGEHDFREREVLRRAQSKVRGTQKKLRAIYEHDNAILRERIELQKKSEDGEQHKPNESATCSQKSDILSLYPVHRGSSF